MNFTPNEESEIREVIEPAGMEFKREYAYSLSSNKMARKAEILIAKMDTTDFDRTSQLLKRVYGVKSTIFVSDAPNPTGGSNYQYVIKRDELNSTLLNMLDRVSQEKLRLDGERKPAAPEKNSTTSFSPRPQRSADGEFYGRILIVDDSPSVRTQLNIYLAERRFECYTAQDSEEAVRAVKQVQFDLIFLDVIMPGVDGYQACKVIKSMASTKQVPVVLLTSKNSPIDRIHGIMSGCDKYLTKPVKSSELEELLRSYFPSFVSRKKKDVL
jgi:twitching motility two-component system response regulator PilG